MGVAKINIKSIFYIKYNHIYNQRNQDDEYAYI